MTSLDTLKSELRRTQEAQAECIDDNGVVFGHSKYRYKILVEQAKDIYSTIKWMEALNTRGIK